MIFNFINHPATIIGNAIIGIIFIVFFIRNWTTEGKVRKIVREEFHRALKKEVDNVMRRKNK